MSVREMRFCDMALLCLLLVPASAGAEICKWVDDSGVTHYAERCPDDVGAREVDIQAPPSADQMEAARARFRQPENTSPTAVAPAGSALKFESLPAERLGPLPENTTSLYLQTFGADLSYDMKSRTGRFQLTLKARENLPAGALIEAQFPDPSNPARTYNDEAVLKFQNATVHLKSPPSSGFRCWNYEVDVFVFSDRSKSDLLDTHRQVIQSRIDTEQISDPAEWAAILAGNGFVCPSSHQADMRKMNAEQLEALCEKEREKRLEPERERLIANCIKAGKKQADWCSNYYADWGDAVRLDPVHVRPALYYDLPECVAAKRARQKSGRP